MDELCTCINQLDISRAQRYMLPNQCTNFGNTGLYIRDPSDDRALGCEADYPAAHYPAGHTEADFQNMLPGDWGAFITLIQPLKPTIQDTSYTSRMQISIHHSHYASTNNPGVSWETHQTEVIVDTGLLVVAMDSHFRNDSRVFPPLHHYKSYIAESTGDQWMLNVFQSIDNHSVLSPFPLPRCAPIQGGGGWVFETSSAIIHHIQVCRQQDGKIIALVIDLPFDEDSMDIM